MQFGKKTGTSLDLFVIRTSDFVILSSFGFRHSAFLEDVMGLRTAFYDWHVAHGGRMVDFAGWDMPVQYTTIVEEHQAVRTGAGLFDISHMGRLSFGGGGSLDLIQNGFTENAATMKDGPGRYGLILNDRGGLCDDVLVYK